MHLQYKTNTTGNDCVKAISCRLRQWEAAASRWVAERSGSMQCKCVLLVSLMLYYIHPSPGQACVGVCLSFSRPIAHQMVGSEEGEAPGKADKPEFKAPPPRKPVAPPPRFAPEPERQAEASAAAEQAPAAAAAAQGGEAGSNGNHSGSGSASAPPPPPKFSAPPTRQAGAAAAKAAADAAARAAQHATPAQRERMVMEAAANVRRAVALLLLQPGEPACRASQAMMHQLPASPVLKLAHR